MLAGQAGPLPLQLTHTASLAASAAGLPILQWRGQPNCAPTVPSGPIAAKLQRAAGELSVSFTQMRIDGPVLRLNLTFSSQPMSYGT